ncbi:MAG: hypothetical protein IJD95_03840 [Clostridia bacterium]|nr:hypothetical protein [Clostridia bacterium]
MNDIARHFYEKGEYILSGFYERPERSQFCRVCDGFASYYRNIRLPEYSGGSLYPTGKAYYMNIPEITMVAVPHHSPGMIYSPELLEMTCGKEYADMVVRDIPMLHLLFPNPPRTTGGFGYTHAIPNYSRIEKEGFNGYRKRVLALKDSDFKDGMLSLIDGIECYVSRIVKMLKEVGGKAELIAAFERVPFEPARNIYEAIVCRNFIFYLDFCDGPGRMDTELIDFYNGEDVVPLLREFFANVNENDGWDLALGPDYNALTLQILKACKGFRRPSIELRVTKDMPRELWEASIESLKTGSGNPCFYNEELYQKLLSERFPHIPKEDLLKFSGCGCTETTLAGICRTGSIDIDVNAPLVFRKTMEESLEKCDTFEEFYEKAVSDIADAVSESAKFVYDFYEKRSELLPYPMRTLLIDDCIDKESDFNAGGARYSWSVVNFAGTINVIDSLLAIKELIYDKRELGAAELIGLLDKGDPVLYKRLEACAHFGVDDEAADSLAAEFSDRLFAMFDNYSLPFGDGFLPCSIQFTTYVDRGKSVGATPDGRRAGEPLCDSLTALKGKATKGPTALINSITKLKLWRLLGTPVVNLSFSPENLDKALEPMMKSYFEQGGLQAQITCVSRDDMIDALSHPERHEDLIVRIGGFSEYFNSLSHEAKLSVIDRTVMM